MKVIPHLCAVLLGAAVGSAAETVWTFSNPGDRFAPTAGAGTMAYYDPGGDGWGPSQTVFGKASSFGLPAMTGGDADVMLFPTCTALQGYMVTHGALENGPYGETDGLISNYTMIMDILYPTANDGVWRALWQTDPTNAQDAEFYVRNQASGGIGISGNYQGRVTPNAWHRITIVVRAAPGEGYFQRFIDGQFVGGYGSTGSAVDVRWAAGPELLLFTDDGGETAGGYLSSLRFVDRALTIEEVQALGGPHAAGATVAGPAAPAYGYQMPRLVKAIGHRGGALCCAPDNTLASVQAAIGFGVPVIEIDTRLSADGVCFLMHDETVDRTTDGTGDAAAMTMAQLKALDSGSWFDPSFAGEKVPTLAEVMTLAKGKLVLYFDLKVNGQIAAIRSAAAATGFDLDQCWFWVYDDEAEAAAIRAAVPAAKIIWGDPPVDWAGDAGFFDLRRTQGVYGFDLATYYGTADAAFTLAAKQQGFIVSCYTVLDPLTMVGNAAAGVDYMETDYGQVLNSLQPPQLVKASLPSPASGATGAPTAPICSWVPGAGATSHRVFFGTTAPGTLVSEQSHDLFARDGLALGITYYWRVDEVTPAGTVTGDVWSFTTPGPTGLADVREWTFDTRDLTAALGTATMTYAAATTPGLTAFGTTDGGAVPHIGGQPATYMSVPAFTDKLDGYLLEFPDLGPNGGGSFMNQYTFFADVFIPGPLDWLPFFQTAPTNPFENDADFYVAPDGAIGIGELGYSAVRLVQEGQWHRIVFAADLGAGVVDMFLDGALVRHRTGGSLRDGRFSLESNANPGPDLFLFNEHYDGTVYTHELLVSSVAFVGHTMTATEITALGGPQAAGIFVTGSSLPELSATTVSLNIVLTWSATAGVRLQRSETLTAGSWADVPGTLGASAWSELIIAGGKRYSAWRDRNSPSMNPIAESVAAAQAAEAAKPKAPVRLASLDAYRGFVMFLMAAELLRLPKVAESFPGSRWWQLIARHNEHVDWTGCSLHDLIQPSFTFMVGVALPFSLASRRARGDSTAKLWVHALWRALVLILLGVFLRSLDRPITHWTFEDTLSQIGFGYPLLFALGFFSPRVWWTSLVVILVGYWAAFAIYPVPVNFDWARFNGHEWFQGFRAHWNQNGNVAWAFDRWFLNLFPREREFLGNGGGYSTLSFLPTLATMVLGLIAGRWLRNEPTPGGATPATSGMTVGKLVFAGLACLALGWGLDRLGVCPSVKKIWTPAWTLFSGGWCFLMMAGFYLVADVWRGRLLFFPFIVLGLNSIAIYVLVHTLAGFLGSALYTHFGKSPFLAAGEAFEPILHGGAVLLIFWGILFWMHQRRLYLRL